MKIVSICSDLLRERRKQGEKKGNSSDIFLVWREKKGQKFLFLWGGVGRANDNKLSHLIYTITMIRFFCYYRGGEVGTLSSFI